KLEPFFSFDREMDLRAAGDARATLELWLESGTAESLPGHDAICEKVRVYNRDDCLSAGKLRDWLEERRDELAKLRGAEVPRPSLPGPTEEDDAEKSAKRVELENLERELRAGLAGEGGASEEQAER